MDQWPDSAKFIVSVLAIILVTLVIGVLSGGNDTTGDVDPDDVVEVMEDQPSLDHQEVERAFWTVWGSLTQAERTDACAYYLIDPDNAIAEMEFYLEHYGHSDELHELLTTACGEL